MNIVPKRSNNALNPIPHLFLEKEFTENFATKNAILSKVPYKPLVLFVGTYNPKTTVNNVDFFYGRNYFWPTIFNLFEQGNITWTTKRKNTNPPFIPDLHNLLLMSQHIRVTFADLIKHTFHATSYQRIEGNVVSFNHKKYNLIADKTLAELDQLGQVDWATEDIISYLKTTPSIRCVRFTRQPAGIWHHQWHQIINKDYGRPIDFGTVHTPTGMGLKEAGVSIAKSLARRWVHHPNPAKRLCRSWLDKFGVPVASLNYSSPPLPLF